MSKNLFANWTPQQIAERDRRIIPGSLLRRPGKAADHKPLPPLDTAAARIGAPTLPARKTHNNRRNDGRAFENALEAIFTRYQSHNLLRLKKCEPPCKVIGFGPSRKVIFLPNPFLDFVGAWTERGGRWVALEAKSTSKPTLALNTDKGLTVRQVDELRRWTIAGGATAVLWEFCGEVRLVMPLTIAGTLARRKSLRWEESGKLVKPGLGLERWQILAALRTAFPA